jgi:hypothetical protein
MSGVHTTSDGIIWKPAAFKGSAVWARVESEEATEVYISSAQNKACVKYKNTPKAQWYWVTPDFIDLKPAGAEEEGGGPRRSKRGRGSEGEAELARELEEAKKLPRPAENGKLYGIMEGSANRKQFVRGKDLKDKCAKCGGALAGEAFIAFIEATKSKTVKKSYGDSGSSWKGTFESRERDFFHLDCWDVPKSAQRSLRGFIDIDGFEGAPEAIKDNIKEKLPLVAVD